MLTFEGSKNLTVAIEPMGNMPGVVYFGAEHDVLSPIEVMVFESAQTTPVPLLREAQKWRKNNQNRSVVVVAVSNGRAQIYGPADDRQPVVTELSTAQRILHSALYEANPIVARNDLVQFFDSYGSSEMPGIKNKGLFASHHLRENLPKRKDWAELTAKGNQIASKRHRALVEALGFSIAGEERNTLILKATGPENRVIAVLLDDTENFDSPSGRFPSSPVAWGLAVAADNNVPWLIVLKKDQIRLHPGRDGVGVGQKGQAETFLELNLAQIDDEHLALLPLIFSAQALERDGEVQKILDESSKYAVILGARLRERVYESVVPNISIAVAKKLQEQGLALDAEGLQKAYSISLRILFRLLFQAYAEDRGLLPAGRNDGYDANSLKTIAKRDMDAQPDDFGNVVGLWYDLVQVWDAIDEGNPRWQVPAYNGGLFGRDPELHPEGALIKALDLPDSVMGPALQALLIDASEDGVRGPVDFRSLSVREFGTIYEGLLESSLSLAEVDLTVDAKDAWVPAQPGDTVMAKAGEPYFHSASGERKATGSYFTPKFVVDHLVERAIDPTIDKHLEKIKGYLDAGDQATANREFFDFRVADLAMGSAHFLVAAVDRIEAKMRTFLSKAENQVPGVIDEIARLRRAATEALRGDEIAIAEIEDPSLLRRQVARRCIYGIDINPMAVELARLAIWIHTFVPGLPMSTLNHNLVCANALTGIGSIDEALDALVPNRNSQPTLFDDEILDGLEKARDLLLNAASASEADKAEVKIAAELSIQAKEAAKDAKTIFDVAIAARQGTLDARNFFTLQDILSVAQESYGDILEDLVPAHMPYLFPEVFMRPNPGFDALVGNPPWEKIKVEEHSWWGLRIPGLRGLAMAERTLVLNRFREARPELELQYQSEVSAAASMRSAILKGPLREGSAAGDPDLYQAFAWRNWQLIRQGGSLSLVLPRSSMANLGLKSWREAILNKGEFHSVIFASNSRQWLFENVDSRYAVALLTVSRNLGDHVNFAGPFFSLREFESGRQSLASVSASDFRSWSDSLSFPSLPKPESIELFLKLKQQPALVQRAVDFEFDITTDLHATQNRGMFDTGASADDGLMPVFSGSSFNLWNPNFGEPYGYGDPQELLSYQAARIETGLRNSRSAYFGLSPTEDLLNSEKPRIAIRAISRAIDSRTIIACLIPPKTLCTHQANVFVNKTSSAKSDAFLLGVLSSIPFDWYARRLTELSVSLDMIRNSPIPGLSESSPIRAEIVKVAGTLAAVDSRYESWAKEVGVEAGKFHTPGEKDELIAKLDALVAIAYSLDSNEIREIFETFHRGWDFEHRLKSVLTHFEEWKDRT